MIAALLLSLAAQDPEVVVDSDVRAVTVYAQGATVRRVARVPTGGTVFLRGLPAAADLETLRVFCDGAEVTGVETRDRLEAALPEARAAELAARIEVLERSIAELEDEDATLAALERHAAGLLQVVERAHAARLSSGRDERLDWLAARLDELAAERRALAGRQRSQRLALADARGELGALETGGGRRVVDVVVKLAGGDAEEATLAAEYLVGAAGWTPVYDLRAPKALDRVELVHRASVRQESGEDWEDVELALSTGAPRRGVTAPEPPSVWLEAASGRGPAAPVQTGSTVEFLGRGLALEEPARAAVVDEGLSVRYVLPRPETVESRREPSTVLVGRADLAVSPEHVVVPALDTTVWLRARTTNTSPWVLLPGRAAVFFGADFVGHADLGSVPRGAELTLHLGADPGLEVERFVLAEETDAAGLFSSRDVWRRKLRFRVKNRGAFGQGAAGAATVVLQESVPRSTDERVVVKLKQTEPKPASGERFDELRETRGVESWLVRVPRGEERTVEATVEISYPEGLELRRW